MIERKVVSYEYKVTIDEGSDEWWDELEGIPAAKKAELVGDEVEHILMNAGFIWLKVEPIVSEEENDAEREPA